MYLRRDLNVRRNTYQYPDLEPVVAPHSKPSVSIKQSRKPLVGDATPDVARASAAAQSDRSTESAARRTGTLTTPAHARQTDDDAGPSGT